MEVRRQLQNEVMPDCTDCAVKISARIRQADLLPLLAYALTRSQVMERRQ